MSNRPGPVCVECGRMMMTDEIGYYVVTMFTEKQIPYVAWHGDVQKCPQCGKRIVTGFGKGPIAVHGDDRIERIVKHIKDKETGVFVYEPAYKE